MALSLPGRTLALAGMLLAGAVAVPPAAAQDLGQWFEVVPERDSVTVGDTVTLRITLHLHERDQLTDSMPRLVGEIPPGFRVLSAEALQRDPRRVFRGRAQVVFFRPGRQAIPTFGASFSRITEGLRGTVNSRPAAIEVVPVLPPGSSLRLKDIRELPPAAGPSPLPLAVAAALLLAIWAARRWARRRRPSAPASVPLPEAPPVPLEPPTAYEVAVERLAGIERERWAERGQVARHYEAVVDALRAYLEAAEELPARERTSAELLWALPPHLSADGLRDRCRDLLARADLVKFARVRPSVPDAAEFLAAARALLTHWHAAAAQEKESVDAAR